jgi:hypothetical protein
MLKTCINESIDVFLNISDIVLSTDQTFISKAVLQRASKRFRSVLNENGLTNFTDPGT